MSQLYLLGILIFGFMLKQLILLSLLFIIPIFIHGQTLLKNGHKELRTLAKVWDLDKENRQGTFHLTSYKPIYVTAGRWTDNPNDLPVSENPDYSLDEPMDFNSFEAKFQLSFKTKVAQSMFWGTTDLWIAYTQVAHWQIFNPGISRAFRELNYEPEVMLVFPINLKLGGLNIKMGGLTFNHQSNGRDLPRSRSWNRIIFNLGLEAKNLQIYLSPWIRLSDEDDENPLITDYIGNGRITAIYKISKHTLYANFTNTFTLKDNRGGLQLNYLFPLTDVLNLHAQFFTGYGETLIDYNHYQNTLGIGVSFINW